ncbi:MAG: hypothetical protein K0S78_3579 [Thermomicrobiales bacterium]|jgi:hypothetical protein|nr:hypothetical protein [Thermomicrobiales bacterium]
MGETIVPFQPRDTLVAIAFESDGPDQATKEGLVKTLVTNLNLTPVLPSPDGGPPIGAPDEVLVLPQTRPWSRRC